MSTNRHPPPALGPDLLARYLNVFFHARQVCGPERPWGLGEEAWDELWVRLTEVLVEDPLRLNRIVEEELDDAERRRIAETLVPLIFAMPMRTYPAELRCERSGPRMVLRLRHTPQRAQALCSERSDPACLHNTQPSSFCGQKTNCDGIESIGHLPAALIPAFADYLKKMLRWRAGQRVRTAVISSGGKRRRVRVSLLARERGLVAKFIERLPSPVDE